MKHELTLTLEFSPHQIPLKVSKEFDTADDLEDYLSSFYKDILTCKDSHVALVGPFTNTEVRDLLIPRVRINEAFITVSTKEVP